VSQKQDIIDFLESLKRDLNDIDVTKMNSDRAISKMREYGSINMKINMVIQIIREKLDDDDEQP